MGIGTQRQSTYVPTAPAPTIGGGLTPVAAGDVKTFGDEQEYESLGTDEKAKNSEWDNITRDRDGKIEYWKKKAERPMS